MGAELLQGDCLELMRGVPAGSVDCVIADLPYKTTQISWDNGIPLPPLVGAIKTRHERKRRDSAFLSNAVHRRIIHEQSPNVALRHYLGENATDRIFER